MSPISFPQPPTERGSTPPKKLPSGDIDYQLNNHQLRTAIMNTVNCLRPSVGSSTLMPETAQLLNLHLAELQAIERERARIVLAPMA